MAIRTVFVRMTTTTSSTTNKIRYPWSWYESPQNFYPGATRFSKFNSKQPQTSTTPQICEAYSIDLAVDSFRLVGGSRRADMI
eukprot:396870-Rhodomonas_salina.2